MTLLYAGQTRTVDINGVATMYAFAGDLVVESRILPSCQDDRLTGPMFHILTNRGWRFCARATDLLVKGTV